MKLLNLLCQNFQNFKNKPKKNPLKFFDIIVLKLEAKFDYDSSKPVFTANINSIGSKIKGVRVIIVILEQASNVGPSIVGQGDIFVNFIYLSMINS